MANRLLIGIGHQARVGKDTLAKVIIENAGVPFVRVAFADTLYEECSALHMCVGIQVGEEQQWDYRGMEGKDPHLLQWWGSWRRFQDPDYWVKSADRKVKLWPEKYGIVFPDVRYKNEANYIKSHGGFLIRVVRPSRLPDRDWSHPSEVDLEGYDKWDYILHNFGTLKEYQEKCLRLCHSICPPQTKEDGNDGKE